MSLAGKGKAALEIVKLLGINPLEEGGKFLAEKINEMVEDEKADRNAFEAQLEKETDEELMLYIPDVYQKSIYKIDYLKLKEAGIKLLSFDIDDTIDDGIKFKALGPLGIKDLVPKKAKKLFKELKSMGFTVTLLTNAHSGVAKPVCKQLKADSYIAKAKKPKTASFEILQKQYDVEKSQMAHIGNSMRADILGGNRFGITTCLVRRNGFSLKVVKAVSKSLGVPTKGHLIREKLLERDLWRKHHLDVKGDQYYQLGETPLYRQ